MPKIKSRNIFSGIPAARKREVCRTLQKGMGFKIERIVSFGQATPEGEWLCSKTAEWVIVLRGRARLHIMGKHSIVGAQGRLGTMTASGGLKRIDLKSGDYVFIPGNTRHRVDWTHPGKKTVWLAFHRAGAGHHGSDPGK